MPGEPNLPTADDVARLPRWARVAFAARCARRVLPAYRLLDPSLPREDRELLTHAVRLAEQACGAAAPHDLTGDLLDRISSLAYRRFYDDRGTTDRTAYPIRRAWYQAIRSAWHAVHCAAGGEYTTPARTTVSAHVAAADAARAAGFDLAPAIRADFDRLVPLTAGWTDETPVPADVFGPLWPDGPPPGWPAGLA